MPVLIMGQAYDPTTQIRRAQPLTHQQLIKESAACRQPTGRTVLPSSRCDLGTSRANGQPNNRNKDDQTAGEGRSLGVSS